MKSPFCPDAEFLDDPPPPPPRLWNIGGGQDLARYLASLGQETHEWLIALYLDNQLKLLSVEAIGRGSVSEVKVDIGLIIARGRVTGAAGFILAHNHPSGDPTPINSDIATTRRIADIARECDLYLLTHVVVSSFGMRTVGYW